MFLQLEPNAAAAERTHALRRLGLLGPDQQARWTPLAGGVSSDIWRVGWPGALALCRALYECEPLR